MTKKKWYDVTVRFTVQAKEAKEAEEEMETMVQSYGVLREIKREPGTTHDL